jgi:hypothetical protein
MMWTFTTIGSCVLVLALLTVLLLVLLVQQQRSSKQIAVWFLSAIVGVLLGVAGSAAAIGLLGYEVERIPAWRANAVGEAVEVAAAETAAEGAPSGPGMGMGPMMGGMGGPPGGFAPSPSRQLTSLVRKIDLLTSNIALNLSAEQTTAVLKLIDGIEVTEQVSDEDAQAKYDAILAVLTEEQKAKQEAIGLPRRTGGGPGGPGAGMGGPGGNPFASEENAAALKNLRARFGAGTPAEEPAEAPAEKTAEKPPTS